MDKIFIITDTIEETRGQGDVCSVKKLSTYDGYNEKLYPAFRSKEDAKAFINKVSKYWKPKITELPIFSVENLILVK
jgi:hypothetical protein